MISQVSLAVQRQLWNMLSSLFRNKRTSSSSQHLPFVISVWASTTITQMTNLTVYESAPANTTLVSILTLSFLLKTHIPGRLKVLTSKGDAFHQWALKIQVDFCKTSLPASEKKKCLNLSVDTNTSGRLQV